MVESFMKKNIIIAAIILAITAFFFRSYLFKGKLLFPTNLRRFRLDRETLPGLEIEDITRRSIPPDFERNPRIHQCFRIRAVR